MATEQEMADMLKAAYYELGDNESIADYCQRHGIKSACILTVFCDEHAALVASHLSERIQGKVVVEIGGGLGLLAFYLAEYAERVIVIEASPVWTSAYVAFLHAHKPKNVTFIFGAADEVAGMIRGNVAIFCTHSDCEGMRSAAALFAPEVIDVYGELIADSDHSDLKTWAKFRDHKVLAQATA